MQSDPAGDVAEVSPRLVEHYNANYGDAVDVLCRARLGTGVTGCRLADIHVDGLSVQATGQDGAPREAQVPFTRPVRTLADLEVLMLAVIAAARDVLGTAELTTVEAQARQVDSVRTYVTSVVRVEQVSSIFTQITFGGGDLHAYLDAHETGGHDQFLYVMTPPEGRTELTVDASFTREDFGRFTDEDRPVGAYYTLRRWRPDAGEIDMLFVLHGIGEDGEDGTAEAGPTARWASRARPGDPVALWGPRTMYTPPADTDWLLLVGDETGLPAIAVILENLPAGGCAQVVVEVGDPADRLALPDHPGVDVTWVVRDGAAGTTTSLVDAVATLDFPDGNVYAWGGAEARAMRAVTSHLRRVRGVGRNRVRMVGYWRHTSTPVDLNSAEG